MATPPFTVQQTNLKVPVWGTSRFSFPAKDLSGANVDLTSGWTAKFMLQAPIAVNTNYGGTFDLSTEFVFTYNNGSLQVDDETGSLFGDELAITGGAYSIYLSNDSFATFTLLATGLLALYGDVATGL